HRTQRSGLYGRILPVPRGLHGYRNIAAANSGCVCSLLVIYRYRRSKREGVLLVVKKLIKKPVQGLPDGLQRGAYLVFDGMPGDVELVGNLVVVIPCIAQEVNGFALRW